MRWWNSSITHTMDMSLGRALETVKDGKPRGYSLQGLKELDILREQQQEDTGRCHKDTWDNWGETVTKNSNTKTMGFLFTKAGIKTFLFSKKADSGDSLGKLELCDPKGDHRFPYVTFGKLS